MTVIKTLTKGLEEGRTVGFVYDDKARIVEVHAIGTSTKDGSAIMRGYQVAGASSRPLPCWALFSIDKIQEGFVSISHLIDSEAPRQGYKMDDKQMTTILGQVKIDEAA